jgi:hypothetical protein
VSERETTVLVFLRSTLFLLTLSVLTAMATIDPSDLGVASIQVQLSTVPAKPRVAQAKSNDAHETLRTGKSKIAVLEDGPEGEQIPLANLVRGYDGDDQIETVFGLTPVRFALSPSTNRKSVELSHPACAGFPTGPPVA